MATKNLKNPSLPIFSSKRNRYFFVVNNDDPSRPPGRLPPVTRWNAVKTPWTCLFSRSTWVGKWPLEKWMVGRVVPPTKTKEKSECPQKIGYFGRVISFIARMVFAGIMWNFRYVFHLKLFLVYYMILVKSLRKNLFPDYYFPTGNSSGALFSALFCSRDPQ